MSTANCTTRGLVLVICNSFVNTEAERTEASECDARKMKQLWGDMLRCHSFPVRNDFIVHCDCTAQQMVDLLGDFANYRSHIEYSYIAVVISTHGGLVAESWVDKWDPMTCDSVRMAKDAKAVYNDYKAYGVQKNDKYRGQEMIEVLFGNDFRPVRESKMKEFFYNDASTVWQDIPKLFILNYCRGDAVDYGVIRIPRPTGVEASASGPRSENVGSTTNAETEAASIMPRISDVLVVYATHRSYVAFRDYPEFGSWLVTTVGEVFMKYAKKLHVVDMLTIVNQKMKKKEGIAGSKKAMSVYKSSLVKNLYLCDEAKRRGDRLDREVKKALQQETFGETSLSFHQRVSTNPIAQGRQREEMQISNEPEMSINVGGSRRIGVRLRHGEYDTSPDEWTGDSGIMYERSMRLNRRGRGSDMFGDPRGRIRDVDLPYREEAREREEWMYDPVIHEPRMGMSRRSFYSGEPRRRMRYREDDVGREEPIREAVVIYEQRPRVRPNGETVMILGVPSLRT